MMSCQGRWNVGSVVELEVEALPGGAGEAPRGAVGAGVHHRVGGGCRARGAGARSGAQSGGDDAVHIAHGGLLILLAGWDGGQSAGRWAPRLRRSSTRTPNLPKLNAAFILRTLVVIVVHLTLWRKRGAELNADACHEPLRQTDPLLGRKGLVPEASGEEGSPPQARDRSCCRKSVAKRQKTNRENWLHCRHGAGTVLDASLRISRGGRTPDAGVKTGACGPVVRQAGTGAPWVSVLEMSSATCRKRSTMRGRRPDFIL